MVIDTNFSMFRYFELFLIFDLIRLNLSRTISLIATKSPNSRALKIRKISTRALLVTVFLGGKIELHLFNR
ncbi:hypothetical protein ES703_103977 [subsurface metagenome]